MALQREDQGAVVCGGVGFNGRVGDSGEGGLDGGFAGYDGDGEEVLMLVQGVEH